VEIAVDTEASATLQGKLGPTAEHEATDVKVHFVHKYPVFTDPSGEISAVN
jgi:hypothetical protein